MKTPAIRRPSTALPRVLSVLGLLAALLLPGAAAQAHDTVEGTSPADGSTVAAVPGHVDLTFEETPLAIGSEVKVTDSSGTNWADGAVTVADKVASQPLKPGAPAGRYTVVWRVVSSDSHAIEGTFTFTAKASSGKTAAAAAPVSSPPAAAAPAQPHGQGVPWGIIAGAVVVVLLVAALALFARRQLKRGA